MPSPAAYHMMVIEPSLGHEGLCSSIRDSQLQTRKRLLFEQHAPVSCLLAAQAHCHGFFWDGHTI